MKKVPGIALILGLAVFFAVSPVPAAMIGFAPSSQDAIEGTLVTVDLVISGLVDGAAPSLSTFDVDVTFDPAILGFNSVSFGDPSLGDQLDLSMIGSETGYDASTPGTINLMELSLDLPDDLNNLQAGAFTLASLTFGTLAVGTSALSLSNVTLGDALGMPLQADLETESVTVTEGTPVPIPSALLLFGSGLIGGSLVKRRKTRSKC